MDGFNPMPALSNGGNTGDPLVLNVNPGGQPLGLDAFDTDLPFDDSLLDNVNNGLQIPFTPSYDFDNFSNFEDPFSYSAPRPYDAAAHVNATGLGVHSYQHESTEQYGHVADSPQELDNKLLGFSAPVPSGKAHLIDGDTGQIVADVGMAAELFGMFFVAEDVYNAEPLTSRPLELTCYRRNLWQCSGQLTLPRHISQLVDETGRQMPIAELAASITAVESIEGKATEIISIPWKSAAAAAAAAASTNSAGAGAQSTEEAAKVASAPPRVTLDLAAAAEAEGGDSDGQRVTVPVSWKRLQFKHATANNGRRKGLQQHYVVQINLLARCAETGAESPSAAEFIKIAEIQSGPVIVRGRSPRNFDSRKDVPLTGNSIASVSGGGIGERKPGRSMSNDTQGSAMGTTLQKMDRTELAQNLQKYHSLGNLQQTGIDWTVAQPFGTPTLQQQQHPPKKMALASPNLNRPPVPAWSSQDSIITNPTPTPKPMHSTPTKAGLHRGGSAGNIAAGPAPTLPINLSLSEDERSPNRSSSDAMSSPQLTTKTAATGGLAGDGNRASPIEDGELLYEYFPLSLDDWMPPVDAIYRPHVVHHTIVPPEVQAQQSRNRTKRYFMPD